MKMRTLARSAAILVALVALPACHDSWGLDTHTLWVYNNSPDTIVVELWVDDWYGFDHEIFLVAPGDAARARYFEVFDMDVLITRQIDGFVLFSGSFDWRDFENDGDVVEIFIGP